jgi:hypothetical protein
MEIRGVADDRGSLTPALAHSLTFLLSSFSPIHDGITANRSARKLPINWCSRFFDTEMKHTPGKEWIP